MVAVLRRNNFYPLRKMTTIDDAHLEKKTIELVARYSKQEGRDDELYPQ